jgi:S-formylglutathione hydrolase FrmB
MALDVISRSRCFDGTQFTYQHHSSETGTVMRFAAFVPPQAQQRPAPVMWYLSGLTCTEENFTVKAGAQRIAAELGLLLIAPDTSPRGDPVPGDPAGSYDFGLGAGFYVDATQQPWSRNYRMASYVERELPGLISSTAGRYRAPKHHGPLHGGTRRPHHCPAQPGSLRISIGFFPDLLTDELPVGRESPEWISRQQQGELAQIRCLSAA